MSEWRKNVRNNKDLNLSSTKSRMWMHLVEQNFEKITLKWLEFNCDGSEIV